MPFVELDNFRVSGRVSQTQYVVRSNEYQLLLKCNVEVPEAPDVMQPISKKEWLSQLRNWEGKVKALAGEMAGKEPKYKVHRPGQLPGLVLPVQGGAVPLSPVLDVSRNSSLSSSVASTPGPTEATQTVESVRTPKPEKKPMYTQKSYPKTALVNNQESIFLALERQNATAPTTPQPTAPQTPCQYQPVQCITPYISSGSHATWGSPLTPPPQRPQTTKNPSTYSAFAELERGDQVESPGSSSRILRMLRERNILSEEE
eukprot:TRINITY_DN9112_c0_g3_i1.p1 TRINITY_DN9112_c0_g3~~TRINITY_DN9112_c0_g3_i1.p1  ORF type:complete len:259 (+),score=26.34 TRINITY_DN9112_c0_g3_i1:826-1602(+)